MEGILHIDTAARVNQGAAPCSFRFMPTGLTTYAADGSHKRYWRNLHIFFLILLSLHIRFWPRSLYSWLLTPD